jgi:hypothetical protein
MPPLQSILLVTLLAVGGCQHHRPDFLSRVREDCAAGERWACDLLDSLARPKPTPLPVTPHASPPIGTRLPVTQGGFGDGMGELLTTCGGAPCRICADGTRNWITLGEVAQRTDMIDIRCGRCERHGRLNVARLLAQHGPETPDSRGDACADRGLPKRNDAEIQNRCDPYCLDLVRLFRTPEKQSAEGLR